MMRLKPGEKIELGEHAAGALWLSDGSGIVAAPTAGTPVVWTDTCVRELAAHGLGNGGLAVHPERSDFATSGSDGKIRIYKGPNVEPRVITAGRAWIQRIEWNPTGELLAAGVGKSVQVYDADDRLIWKSPAHKSTVCDFAWNPNAPTEIAVACDGGAYLWRVGDDEPFARFDWGGASLIITWSPDSRWVVTGDQTPSVHLYDVPRDFPLHIQGYDSKVKALSMSSNSRKLATSGSALITVWNCTGKTGPENTTPRQLEGHDDFCTALAYRKGEDLLASGGQDGRVLVFEPEKSTRPVAAYLMDAPVVSVVWHPSDPEVLVSTASGRVQRFDLAEK